MRLWGDVGSLFLGYEELGKKDDDQKGPRLPTIRSQPNWASARPPPRRTIKRLGLALLIGLVVYVFVHNIPTDLGQRDHRHPVYDHSEDFYPPSARAKPRPPPAKHVGSKTETKAQAKSSPAQTFDGPVKFPDLGESLQAISSIRGGSLKNKNVLFAASSLKSAAVLLPIACQMGSELRSYVHFALMSRSEIGLDELRAVNGIDDSCHIIFHGSYLLPFPDSDARPDFPLKSTQDRLARSVGRALFHIHSYMHPQAVVVDASATEDEYFLTAIRGQAKNLGVPVINLPAHSQKQLEYMTKLDANSLAAWNNFRVDIIIHASTGASGSVMRLLKSLSSADYSSNAVPHLTIELPHHVDPPTVKFLETFPWPPAHMDNPANINQLTIRRRIPRWSLKEEESSIRFLESFWPAQPRDSHALILSPQTELSPHFFHYLKYTVLEYKFSTTAQWQEWDTRLLGISLSLPTTLLSDPENEFIPPTKRDVKPQTEAYPVDGPTPFFWQAPDSNALFMFGQKWVELHGFVTRLTDTTHRLPSTPASFLSKKEVSKRHPSWLEQALRLSRARGYWTLYPGELPNGGALAVVHKELAKAPEEYGAEIPGSSSKQFEREGELAAGSLLGLIGSPLPPFGALPIVDWQGKVVALEELDKGVQTYASEFRAQVSGDCEELTADGLAPKADAADLFCEREE